MAEWRKIKGLKEWTVPGYVIEQTDDDPVTMVATATGEGNRGGEVGRYTAEAGETAARLLKRAKRACEEHSLEPVVPQAVMDAAVRADARATAAELEQAAKLGVATALDWTTRDNGELVAGPYTVSRSRASEAWRAHYHDPAGVPHGAEPVYLAAASEPEPLQQLCLEHKAGEGLEWRETAIDCWLGSDGGPLTYRIKSDGPLWQSTAISEAEASAADDEEIGADDTPEEAMAQCQIHRGRRLLEQGDTKPDTKPARERGRWTIRRPPSQELKAALADKQADCTKQIRALEAEIKRSAERHKALKAAKDEEIAELREREDRLAHEVEWGATAVVECLRERWGNLDGYSEWRYFDPDTGEELFREPAADGEQLRLAGKETAPADKPPGKSGKLAEVELAIERAFDERTPEAITAAGLAIDAAALHLQHGQLEQLRARYEAVAANEANEARQPGDEQPTPDPLPADRELTRADFKQQTSGDYIAGDPDGDHYRISKPEGYRHYQATFRDASGARELPGSELPGMYRRLKSAIAGCSADNRKRLRWPCSSKANVQVSACNRYQVTLTGSGDRHHLEGWRAEAVGGQDEDNVGLGEHGSLAEARAACQEHKDGGGA
jgi:hypothetical protein